MTGFWDLSAGAKLLLAACCVVVLGEGAYLFYVQTHHAAAVRSCEYAVSLWEEAEPQDSAGREKYAGPIAEVRFDDQRFPQAAQFRTAISEAVQGGANFAGHYAIAEWGCGTACQDHAVVDVRSGAIVAFGIPSEAGLRYSERSALIMTNPPENFPSIADLETLPFADQAYWLNLPREYYVLNEDGGAAAVSRLCIENPYEGQI